MDIEDFVIIAWVTAYILMLWYCIFPMLFHLFTPNANPDRGKVENILKGNLDLISSPSPSVKIQILWAGKFA